MNLLDQAKNIATRATQRAKAVSKEEIELALALLRGEISYRAVAEVLGKKKNPGNSMLWAMTILRRGIIHKQLEIKIVKK